jgi:uncharacterized protein YndB with AHSA1/START domain
MGAYRFSVQIAAAPDRVFDLWTDLDRMKEWVGGVTKVTDVSGPLDRAGTRYTVWFGGMRSQTEVLEVERPRRIKTRFGNRVLRGQALVTLEPGDGGTRLTQEFRTEGLVPALMARIFATGSYKGSFRGELNEFAKLAERESGVEDRAGHAGPT